MNTETYFEEKQYFRQWWVWLLVLSIDVVVLYSLFSSNSNETDKMTLVITVFLTIGASALIFFCCLHTQITKDGITYRFFPFINAWQNIYWYDIKTIEVRKYSPISEFGGWGVRLTFSGKRAYNIAGNMGVDITLKNGESLLIGTQKPAELKEALDKVQVKK